MHAPHSAVEHHLILYDGLCGMCNRFVRSVIRRDSRDLFRFAALQSVEGTETLARHSIVASGANTVYVVQRYSTQAEFLLNRSDAVLFVLRQLDGFGRTFARLATKLPHALLDSIYNLVARNRHRFSRRLDSCPIPRPQDKHRFIG